MTAPKKDIPVEVLRERIEYNPETGELLWLPVEATNKHLKVWNKRFSGSAALNHEHHTGYKVGRLMGKHMAAHRVAWAIYTGEWPSWQIDHINGDRSDNRIANLREVSDQENARNRKLQNNNTTGSVGISWHKRSKKWNTYIKVNGKMKHLGDFSCIGAAICARLIAERDNEFHKNHGRKQ